MFTSKCCDVFLFYCEECLLHVYTFYPNALMTYYKWSVSKYGTCSLKCIIVLGFVVEILMVILWGYRWFSFWHLIKELSLPYVKIISFVIS